MSEKKLYILRIEKEFKNLIRPLKREEYIQLEDNILNEGCRDPIVVWHYTIVDGHNRYEICKRHQIPFAILEMEFECKEAAIAWICANQLGRRSITDETRKFLIGMQYESEKIVHAKKNADGINQYSAANLKGLSAKQVQQLAPTGHMTAQKIAEENHISPGTVQKYAVYTRALERIGSKAPTLVPKILSGEYKISHKNIMALAEMGPEEIKKLSRRIERSQQAYVQYNRTRREIQEYCTETAETDERPAPSVKDMPAFDPDAEITGLTLTIPSWASSIDRTRTKANLTIISSKARNNLIEALLNLQIAIEEMCEAVNDEQLIIRDLVESYGLTLSTKKGVGTICAISTVEQIYKKYGYHGLNRVLRLIIGAWEGDMHSFSANMLNGVARLVVVYGDTLNDALFVEKLGAVSVKHIMRTAKERKAGSMGVAEAMILEYNGKKKSNQYRLQISKLYSHQHAIYRTLDDIPDDMLHDDVAELYESGLMEGFEDPGE